ncbi:MAG: phosphopantothenate/pantothenate synthetase [Methanospirillum sp.]|uniref:4-phosphopantoate--beta-alanine ligase n=1 Tax=Methanospirillum sp. TaxID=45200 RepID=UPI00236AA1EA|nr:4-phosphopantoate--beta-alanine ligase [Methanospirillum sp.]MDD1729182.1 phosphopantothenate/pantothenate synthetase [Methanospirillum sp.]
MIPESHPRYRSLITRERMASGARAGVVALEGLTAHGRGEAFDYLLGEETSTSAARAERVAAALLKTARHPVISVNGNTAMLCAGAIASLQKVSGAIVEVNLFHRTDDRITAITRILEDAGCKVLAGPVARHIPLDHDRGICHADGMAAADVILVPLEDGDRAEALVIMGKIVIAIDLNPLSRTARTATLPIIDEVTRAVPGITAAYESLDKGEADRLVQEIDAAQYLREAIQTIRRRLDDVLD